MTHQLKISLGFGTILMGSVFALCWMVGDTPADHYLNFAVYIAGWATGWAIGTFVAPYDGTETALFGRMAQAIGAFVSGFLLARLDGIGQRLTDPAFILQPVPGFRLLCFVSVTAVVAIIVYSARHYANWHRASAAALTRPELTGRNVAD